MNAADLRNIAVEARPIIDRMMADAEVLAALGKVCRDKGIDWGQLKALIKAQIRDDADGGERVATILERAGDVAAYADLLGNMNKKNFSDPPQQKSAPAPEAPQMPARAFLPPSGDDDGIPEFLDRRLQRMANGASS